MQAQDLFDTIVEHLLAMPARSGGRLATGQFECRYRGPDGARCAIGVLIHDDEYRQDMEGNDVVQLDRDGVLPSRLAAHLDMLRAMQRIHDKDTAWRNGKVGMRRMLDRAARKHGLVFTQ